MFIIIVELFIFWLLIKFIDFIFAEKPVPPETMIYLGEDIQILGIKFTRLDTNFYVDPSNTYAYGRAGRGNTYYDYYFIMPSIQITQSQFFEGIQVKQSLILE